MKLNYDIIKKNLETYKEAKELFPIISEFESGQVNYHIMCKLGLGQFAIFSNFLKTCSEQGCNPIMKGMTWCILKPMLVEETKNERLKKFIFNRTQRQFNEILNEGTTFDRYLNGRWISKPKLTRTGRLSLGRRSQEYIESLKTCIIPILNYIIENNIDVYDDPVQLFSSKENYKPFKNQQYIEAYVCWYTTNELDLSGVPKREIEVTRKLLNSLAQIIEDSNIDFRKLNLDYIVTTMTDKIHNLMKVKEGTRLKSLSDYYYRISGNKCLIKDNYYEVIDSSVSDGYVTIMVNDESGRNNWLKYSQFEDVQLHREDLLNSLLG